MLLPLICLGLAIVGYLLELYYIPKHAANEPPVVSSTIPYIGHVLGLLRHGTRYYSKLSAKCGLPIYTLPMLNGKVYVVTSIDFINAINRSSKVLAFNPFLAELGKRITGHDEATKHIVGRNLNNEDGPGYVPDIHDGTISSLAPGPALESMTGEMLVEAEKYFENLKSGTVIDLFAWIKRTVTMCSTRAAYGPANPFNQDPERYVKAFW